MDGIHFKQNSDLILSFLKSRLEPFFSNINFNILFHQTGTVFYIKDIEVRKDVLQNMGIPLFVREGKVSLIKISIENLLKLSPIKVEISDIVIEVNSIYLTKEYNGDFASFRKYVLKRWEAFHKSFFIKPQESNGIIEKLIINCINNITVHVKNFKFIVIDNMTIAAESKKLKKFELKVIEAYSFCGDNSEEQGQKENIERKIQLSRVVINIYKQTGDDKESMSINDSFLQPLNMEMTLSYKSAKGFNKERKSENKSYLELFININEPMVMNISKDKVSFLINLVKYLSIASKVQKYWWFRPDIGKCTTKKEGIEILKYAFKCVRMELRKRQENSANTYWFKDAVNIERYTQGYKNYQILTNPSPLKKNVDVLKDLEKHMMLKTILHCREYVFIKLAEEKKLDVQNKDKIKPLFKNDPYKWLKFSEWTKRQEEEIEKKLEIDETLSRFAKGEPADKLIKANIKIKLFILNIARNVKSGKRLHEIAEQMKFYQEKYDKETKKKLNPETKEGKKVNLLNWINSAKDPKKKVDFLKEVLSEEMKIIEKVEMDNELNRGRGKTITNYSLEMEGNLQKFTSTLRKSPSLSIPGLSANQNLEKTNQNANRGQQMKKPIDNPKAPKKFPLLPLTSSSNINTEEQAIKYDKIEEQFSKKVFKKLMISFVFTNIEINFFLMRNNSIDLDATILTFNTLDHNLSFTIANANEASLLKKLLEQRYSEPTFHIENMDFPDEQVAFESFILNSFFDCLTTHKYRNQILSESFLSEEKEFLNQFEYQFRFMEENVRSNVNYTLLSSIYSNVLVKYYFKKNMLHDLINAIEERLKAYRTIDSLLTPDNSNLKSTFIIRLISKAESMELNHLNSKGNQINFGDEKNGIPREGMLNQNAELTRKICEKLQKDLSEVFIVIFSELVKNIISPLMLYFIFENGTYEVLYQNLLKYAEITKRGFKGKENKNFLNVNMHKKGLVLDNNTTNTLKISLVRSILVNISNEIIAELSVLVPSLFKSNFSNQCECTGDVYEDLKKAYMDVYDDFLKLKDDLFKEIGVERINANVKADSNLEDKERLYIDKRKILIEKYLESKFKIELEMDYIIVQLFDNVFFANEGKCSSLTIFISKIKFTNEKLKKFPIEELKEIKIKNKKDNGIFDLFYKTSINLQNFEVLIDSKEKMIETNFVFDFFSSLWDNIYFLQNSLIDIHSSFIKMIISPLVTKVIFLAKHFEYYKSLYQDKFAITSKPQNQFQLKQNEMTNKRVNLNQIIEYTNFIENLMCYDENVCPLKYYFINRISSSLFYSVGSKKEGKDGKEGKDRKDEGIFLSLNADDYITRINGNAPEKKILSFHIPLLIFTKRESLFYEDSQLWISSINTIEQEQFLQKIKVTFNKNWFNFNSFEFLFSPNLLNSIGYTKKIPKGQIDYSQIKSLFDNKNYRMEELNIVISRLSYYYEETNLKEQYDLILKGTHGNFGGMDNFKQMSNLHSNLSLNIEGISIVFNFINNHQDIFLLSHNVEKFITKYEKMLNQMYTIEEIRENNENLIVQSSKRQDTNSTNFPTSYSYKEVNEISNEKSYPKFSLHMVDFMIKKISLKVLFGEDKRLDNIGMMLFIKDINYFENKDLENIKEEIKVMNMFYITSVKLFISVPPYFSNRSDFEVDDGKREILFDKDKMLGIFDEIKKQKNELIVLFIKNAILQQSKDKISFKINQSLNLGFMERTKEEIKKTKEIVFSHRILSFVKYSNLEDEKLEKELEYVWNEEAKRRICANEFQTDSALEIEIEKTPKVNFKPIKNRGNLNTLQLEEQKNELKMFSYLFKMIKGIKSAIIQDLEYTLFIKSGLILVEIPSIVFNYIYFIINYYKEARKKIKAARQLDKFKNLFLKIDNKEKGSIKMMSLFEKIKGKEFLKASFNEKNDKNVKDEILYSLVGRYFSLRRKMKEDNKDKDEETKSVKKNSLSHTERKKSRDTIMLEVKFLRLKIPILVIIFKQLEIDEEEKLIPFSYIIPEMIDGSISLSDPEKRKDIPLRFNIKNVRWKADARVKELIKYKSSNAISGDARVKEFIKNKSSKAISGEVYLFRPINNEKPLIIMNIEEIIFVFAFKIIREMILFFEFNTRVLDENPMKTEIQEELVKEKEDSVFVQMHINDSSLILVENSQSANYLCINIKDADIEIRRKDDSPKILLSPLDKDPAPQIIDEKTIFNISSFLPIEEPCLHTEVAIHGEKLAAFICINKIKNHAINVDSVGVLIKAPCQDKKLTMVRKKMWREKHGEGASVVTYKPSVSLREFKGNLNSNLGFFLALKRFMDGNFDEESNIIFLREPEANYNGIELNIEIPHGSVMINNFECCKETIDEMNIDRIGPILPGEKKEIEYEDEIKNGNQKSHFKENESQQEKGVYSTEEFEKKKIAELPEENASENSEDN